MKKMRWIRSAQAFILSCALTFPVFASDLELLCKPIYAREDTRQIRPEYTWSLPRHFTYFLFENRDLFHYRVELVNKRPESIQIGHLDWPDRLHLTVWRNGEKLPEDAVRMNLLRKTKLDVVYYFNGQEIEEVLFQKRANGFGSEPLQEVHDSRRVRVEVDNFPFSLETYQQTGVEISLVGPDEKSLPPGDYTINFEDPVTGSSCAREQLVIMRSPETDLDRVESRIVRYNYLKSQNDPEAGAELQLAYAEAPESLTAMYYYASYAAEIGDYDLQVETIERIRDLMQSSNVELPDSKTVQLFSRDAVRSLDKLRLQAASASAEKNKNLVDAPVTDEQR